MQNHPSRAVFAGIVATAVMSLLMVMAPMMGLPRMSLPGMIATWTGVPIVLGWVIHFGVGSVLAVLYAGLFAAHLHGPGPVRGMLYALLPWIVAGVVVMPMMGIGVFGGSTGMAIGSLIGHLVYGLVLGGIYPAPRHATAMPRHVRA